MNRLILRHKYLVTFVILAILAWVVYRRIAEGGSGLIGFAAVTAIVWVVGTFVFIYLWPSFTYSAYRRAIVKYGLGGGPIPVNTLYAVPEVSSPSASFSSMLATGTDDGLYFGGWLDLSEGAQVLHTPDMAGRYYSVQFTDPSDGTNFAYVGTRTTGTWSGGFLITGPDWKGTVPQALQRVSSPNNAVMVLGRAMVESESGQAVVYALTKQFQLTPLGQWNPGR